MASPPETSPLNGSKIAMSSQPPRPAWIQRETAFPTASPAQPRCCWPRGRFTPRSSARWPMSPYRGALLSTGLPTCLRLSKVDAPHVSSSPHLSPRPQLAPPTCFFVPGLELPGIYFLTFLPNTRLLAELFTHYYGHLCQTRC